MDEKAKDVSAPGPVPGPAPDPRLLELLVCPLTKTRLEYDGARQELISRAAGLAYPVRSGVPLLIQDAARPLDDQDRRR